MRASLNVHLNNLENLFAFLTLSTAGKEEAVCTGMLVSVVKGSAHPVLTSQAEVPCCSIFWASMAAYFMGCHMRKAPPKQALKVASGSVTPISVPATCSAQGHVSREHLDERGFSV